MWSTISNFIWPIFFLIILFPLKEQFKLLITALSKLCERVAIVEFKGFKFDTNSSILLGKHGISDGKFFEMLKTFQSPIVTNEEKTISSQIIDYKWSEKQAIDVLISQLANRNVQILLFCIDKSIFNEQIKLLLYLNSQNRPCPGQELYHFYSEWLTHAKKNYDEKINENDHTFGKFLGFLSTNGLINQDISGYTITLFGKEYLSFLVRIGRQFPKDIIYDSSQESAVDSAITE